MVPQTYPSILNPYTNMREMVVKQLASTSGLQRWVDYIPMKLATSTRPAGEQTTDADGFIAINSLQDTSSGVAFKDWVPVYFDSDATDAWVVSDSGYIPVGASGGAIAILQSFGSDAHVYLPGSSGVSLSGLMTNNYTLSDGSTGYSAVDGTAGRVLDAAGSVGPELVTNGDFSDGATGWTLGAGWAVSGGVLVHTSAAYEYATFLTGAAFTEGATYRVAFTQVSGASGLNVFVKGGSASTSGGAGEKVVYVVASSSTTGFRFGQGAADTVIDNISVKQVTGIHATQATTANKPALRRGLLNRATYSHDLTNVGYNKVNVSTAAGTVARTSTAASSYLNGPAFPTPFAVGEKITAYAKVKAKSLGGYFGLRPSGTYPDRLDALFNLNTGAVVGQANGGGFSGAAATIAGPDGNGFYIVAVSGTVGTTTCRNIICGPADSTASVSSWEGTQSTLSDVYIEAQGISPGTLTAAQILAEGGIPLTTSAAASNQSAGRYSWQFDGSNDSLALGSVPFQMNDDHCVIAGWRADVFQNSVVAPSHTSNTARYGSIGTSSGGNGIITEWYDGTQYINHQTVVAKGSVNVTSATKASGTVKSRNNGVSFGSGAAFSTAVQGNDAAISPTSALGIFTGAIGPVILIKGAVSDADLLTLERWVASQTPAAPSF